MFPQHIQKSIEKLPNQAGLQYMLEHSRTCEIWTENPNGYLLIKTNAPYAYLAGTLENQDLEAVCAFLKTHAEIKLVCEELYHHFFFQKNFVLCPRIQLIYPQEKINRLYHPEYSIEEITTDYLFEKCTWYNFVSLLHGSLDKFLETGFGVALSNGSTVVSEAYAVYVGGGFCEVGIVTHPDYRGKNLASYPVSHIIAKCKEKKLTAIWSCDYANTASLKAALKSGFVIDKYYAFVIKSNNL